MQPITVNNPKIEQIWNGVYNKVFDKLVVDAKLILIERSWGGKNNPGIMRINDKYFQPLLISMNEKIKDSDWAYSMELNELFKVKESKEDEDHLIDINDKIWYTNTDPHQCYKVLALPQNFSPHSLKLITNGELNKNDNVVIECKKLYQNSKMNEAVPVLLPSQWDDTVKVWHIIEFDYVGFVTIHQTDNKPYTKADLRNAFVAARELKYAPDHDDTNPIKWNNFEDWFKSKF